MVCETSNGPTRLFVSLAISMNSLAASNYTAVASSPRAYLRDSVQRRLSDRCHVAHPRGQEPVDALRWYDGVLWLYLALPYISSCLSALGLVCRGASAYPCASLMCLSDPSHLPAQPSLTPYLPHLAATAPVLPSPSTSTSTSR